MLLAKLLLATDFASLRATSQIANILSTPGYTAAEPSATSHAATSFNAHIEAFYPQSEDTQSSYQHCCGTDRSSPTHLGTLVWKRLLTGMRPLLSSSMPTVSRPRFWVKGRLPMQTSSTSQVRVSFFPPAAASTLKDTGPPGEKVLQPSAADSY